MWVSGVNTIGCRETATSLPLFRTMIEENEKLVRRIFEEAIEDVFMNKAIGDSKKSRKVSREKIFRTLAVLNR